MVPRPNVLGLRGIVAHHVLAADLVGEEAVREGFAGLRADLEDLRSRVQDAQGRAETLPHREKYLGLTLEFVEGMIDLYEELVEKVEREFAAAPAATVDTG